MIRPVCTSNRDYKKNLLNVTTRILRTWCTTNTVCSTSCCNDFGCQDLKSIVAEKYVTKKLLKLILEDFYLSCCIFILNPVI